MNQRLQRASLSAHGREIEEGRQVPPTVHEILREPGRPLDPATRSFFEPRFGYDFSRVRVHTDANAVASARKVDALAYTIGPDIAFAAGQYAPQTRHGRWLLAHELVHVLRQSQGRTGGEDLQVAPASSTEERETDGLANGVLRGNQAMTTKTNGRHTLARFTVRGHHIIEEAALVGAGFSEKEREAVHRGNRERDFSQVGRTGNTLLLCDPSSFGGYSAAEHFDNYLWDRDQKRWRSGGVSNHSRFSDLKHPDTTPIDYIGTELISLADAGMNEESLVHLGNAFHTVEDFFAHSTFVELINNDFRSTHELLTGSVSGTDASSVYHTLEVVSPPGSEQFYRTQAEAKERRASPLSHSRLAKDQPSRRYHEQARQLAALVIQQLAGGVRVAMKPHSPETRKRLIEELVLKKVHRYLRPPSPDDPWWQQLRAEDSGVMARKLEEVESRTPETVGQCMFSPLTNMEASRLSTMHIPIGMAVPVVIGRDHIWLQAGFGVVESQPLPFDPSSVSPVTNRSETPAALFAGAQITGRF